MCLVLVWNNRLEAKANTETLSRNVMKEHPEIFEYNREYYIIWSGKG